MSSAHTCTAGIAPRADEVSVVVIGRNEGERLQRCLESIAVLAPNSRPLEVIYVDSGSTDASLRLAAGSGARVIALKPTHPTAALGRNAGWRAAKGEIVLFLDGDTVLAPDFLEAALPVLADEAVAVVWGHRRELHPEASVYNRVMDLDWLYAAGVAPFCGGDALFRRRVLEKTNGFDETLIAGEEPELCRRIIAGGSTIVHIDQAMTGHDLAITRFSQYWRRAKRAGHAYADISSRFARTDDPFWSADANRNRRRGFALIAFPILAVVAGLLLRSLLPLRLLLLLVVVLTVYTAWNARWKSRSLSTLLLYGVHSHLQQIPIFFGQLECLFARRRGEQRALMEYKGTAP